MVEVIEMAEKAFYKVRLGEEGDNPHWIDLVLDEENYESKEWIYYIYEVAEGMKYTNFKKEELDKKIRTFCMYQYFPYDDLKSDGQFHLYFLEKIECPLTLHQILIEGQNLTNYRPKRYLLDFSDEDNNFFRFKVDSIRNLMKVSKDSLRRTIKSKSFDEIRGFRKLHLTIINEIDESRFIEDFCIDKTDVHEKNESKQENEILRNCPFCGGEVVPVLEYDPYKGFILRVQCVAETHPTIGFKKVAGTGNVISLKDIKKVEKELYDLWNTRV